MTSAPGHEAQPPQLSTSRHDTKHLVAGPTHYQREALVSVAIAPATPLIS
jgi:hypothetical protein